MNKLELKIASELLDLAADLLDNHGCNDFVLKTQTKLAVGYGHGILEQSYRENAKTTKEWRTNLCLGLAFDAIFGVSPG